MSSQQILFEQLELLYGFVGSDKPVTAFPMHLPPHDQPVLSSSSSRSSIFFYSMISKEAIPLGDPGLGEGG